MTFSRLLLVIKQTAFNAYTAQEHLARAAGRALTYAPDRMSRLKERHDTHMFQVERITRLLQERGASVTSVMRDEVTPAHVADADLVLALGGDGTTLIASHIMRGDVPLIGINTDRATSVDLATLYRSSEPLDMRRSTGHLCACTSADVEPVLDDVLTGALEPTTLARLRVTVAGAELAPALNDVLVAHPSPGAVSRYSVHVGGGDPGGVDRGAHAHVEGEIASAHDPNSIDSSAPAPLWFHVRSSGIRACTAAGSTAAMRSAGGKPMHFSSRRMQFMDREPIYHDHMPPPSSGHGFYDPDETMTLRWNSRVGRVFLDGAHNTHEVKMGDRITVSANGPTLRLFTSKWFRRNHAEMWPDRREAMREMADDASGPSRWIIDE
jgi:NAD+ kinase